MHGLDRDDKAQTVCRGDLTPTPGLSQRDPVLGGDQPRIRCGQGLGADVIVLDPAEPERRSAGTSGQTRGSNPVQRGARIGWLVLRS